MTSNSTTTPSSLLQHALITGSHDHAPTIHRSTTAITHSLLTKNGPSLTSWTHFLTHLLTTHPHSPPTLLLAARLCVPSLDKLTKREYVGGFMAVAYAKRGERGDGRWAEELVVGEREFFEALVGYGEVVERVLRAWGEVVEGVWGRHWRPGRAVREEVGAVGMEEVEVLDRRADVRFYDDEGVSEMLFRMAEIRRAPTFSTFRAYPTWPKRMVTLEFDDDSHYVIDVSKIPYFRMLVAFERTRSGTEYCNAGIPLKHGNIDGFATAYRVIQEGWGAGFEFVPGDEPCYQTLCSTLDFLGIRPTWDGSCLFDLGESLNDRDGPLYRRMDDAFRLMFWIYLHGGPEENTGCGCREEKHHGADTKHMAWFYAQQFCGTGTDTLRRNQEPLITLKAQRALKEMRNLYLAEDWVYDARTDLAALFYIEECPQCAEVQRRREGSLFCWKHYKDNWAYHFGEWDHKPLSPLRRAKEKRSVWQRLRDGLARLRC